MELDKNNWKNNIGINVVIKNSQRKMRNQVAKYMSMILKNTEFNFDQIL